MCRMVRIGDLCTLTVPKGKVIHYPPDRSDQSDRGDAFYDAIDEDGNIIAKVRKHNVTLNSVLITRTHCIFRFDHCVWATSGIIITINKNKPKIKISYLHTILEQNKEDFFNLQKDERFFPWMFEDYQIPLIPFEDQL